ncbi:hypothetical protein [Pseudomonas sp. PS02290]|uniref:hypothetical protein n=1 Tax=Pseudomonas sp. PS02290 TaxID=2991430 RepID=UPI002499EF02|nr:hypothetical protein [Pseudomonas sp. PS02290]
MSENQRDLLVRCGIYLLASLLCAAIFYGCWHYVGSRISLDFPANTLGGSLEFPIQLACTVLLSMLVGMMYMGLTLTLPRLIRRKRFWRRKHAESAN